MARNEKQLKAKREAVYNPEADRKWREANKERAAYMRDRTAARRFLRKAKAEDLPEMEQLIAARREALAAE